MNKQDDLNLSFKKPIRSWLCINGERKKEIIYGDDLHIYAAPDLKVSGETLFTLNDGDLLTVEHDYEENGCENNT